ncbi:hypothetical protein [Nocardioides sp.]|uniref:hypothetical protein n=1 Tax=Nocardioides sp. TaxID=35761 RepID=UPI0019921631|nr:hypothetical protein [Nocardioides sp.]MBC7274902.1 hypothetical protein [Nocardioides sp.]
MELTQQFVTLGAVVVGAAMSYLAATATERRRHRNEAAARWEQRRVDLYADYAEVAKRILRQTEDVGKHDPASDDFGAAASKLRTLEEDRSALFERLMLIGDRATIEAAHKLNHVMWTLQSELPGAVPYTPEWHETPWVVPLNDLHACARAAVLNPKRADLSTDFPVDVSSTLVQFDPGEGTSQPRAGS